MNLVGGLEPFFVFQILGIIIPIDFNIFRGVETTNQKLCWVVGMAFSCIFNGPISLLEGSVLSLAPSMFPSLEQPKMSAAGEFCNDSEDNVPYGSPDAIEMCEVLSQALQMHQSGASETRGDDP